MCPDISMCANENCGLKKKCYRFTAEPCEWMQSYSDFEQDDKGFCEYFWDNERRKSKKTK